MAGCKPAKSLPVKREKETECGASVSRGLKRVNTRALHSHSLLCCCAPFILAVCAIAKLVSHLLKATLEFIRRPTGCIIALL